jgi:NAD-dependent aldehyde dehydrogenases
MRTLFSNLYVTGPIIPILSWKDEEEVIRRANDTDSGLGACVWSKDSARALSIGRQLEVGSVWINSYEKPAPAGYFPGISKAGSAVNGVVKVFCPIVTRSQFIFTNRRNTSRGPVLSPLRLRDVPQLRDSFSRSRGFLWTIGLRPVIARFLRCSFLILTRRSFLLPTILRREQTDDEPQLTLGTYRGVS